MHKNILVLVTISFLAATVVFTGCNFNLFSTIDRPSVPSVSDIEGRSVDTDEDAQDFLSDVEDWKDGDVLADDPDAAKAVVAKLEEVYDPASGFETETQQEAAVLAGDIAFTSDENVAELEDNVISTMIGMMEGEEETEPEDILNSLMPEDITEEEFTEMINSILSAQDAYDAYGGSLNNEDGSGSELNLTEGEEATIAQRALMAAVVDYTVGALGETEEEGIANLYKLIDDDPDNDTEVNTDDLDDPLTVLDEDSGNYDQNLMNIFTAAGMADMFE
ncbi:MAG: hypothetical protein ACLFNZ_05580 [Spirochaetaceae bacterium]